MRIKDLRRATKCAGLLLVAALPMIAVAQDSSDLPGHLHDRGTGIPTSMFGTYVRPGELLVYPFFEYVTDRNQEYQPSQFGVPSEQDYRGTFRDSKEQIFLGYGLSERLAVEFEAAIMHATFEKDPGDISGTPDKVTASGVGDVEGWLHFRWMTERDRRPEIFSFLEVTAPSHRKVPLIGDPDWDVKPGVGFIRGFSWGTLTFRTDLEFNGPGSGPVELGETALEYMKNLSSAWRGYLALEGGEGGAPDEWSVISGLRWRLTDWVFLKFDNSLSISSKATDWEPQIGWFFSFPVAHHAVHVNLES